MAVVVVNTKIAAGSLRISEHSGWSSQTVVISISTSVVLLFGSDAWPKRIKLVKRVVKERYRRISNQFQESIKIYLDFPSNAIKCSINEMLKCHSRTQSPIPGGVINSQHLFNGW